MTTRPVYFPPALRSPLPRPAPSRPSPRPSSTLSVRPTLFLPLCGHAVNCPLLFCPFCLQSPSSFVWLSFAFCALLPAASELLTKNSLRHPPTTLRYSVLSAGEIRNRRNSDLADPTPRRTRVGNEGGGEGRPKPTPRRRRRAERDLTKGTQHNTTNITSTAEIHPCSLSVLA